jgi:hypothetical protein
VLRDLVPTVVGPRPVEDDDILRNSAPLDDPGVLLLSESDIALLGDLGDPSQHSSSCAL